MDGKSVSRSVSLAEGLWELIDAHSEGHGGRSEFIRRVAMEELKREGKLPGSELETVLAEAKATVDIVGPERVQDSLKRLRNRAGTERAAASC